MISNEYRSQLPNYIIFYLFIHQSKATILLNKIKKLKQLYYIVIL